MIEGGAYEHMNRAEQLAEIDALNKSIDKRIEGMTILDLKEQIEELKVELRHAARRENILTQRVGQLSEALRRALK